MIGPDGEQIGILPILQAIKKADEHGLDLVEISPTAKPPVCRIMDFGKYKYEQAKKQHSSRQHQRSMQLKEVKVRPYTDKHDLEIKVRSMRRFLEDKNKAKITVTFRGRERAHTESAKVIMEAFIEGAKEIGIIEYPPMMEGGNMIMIIAPKSDTHKGKKSSEQSAAEEGSASEGRENEQNQAKDA